MKKTLAFLAVGGLLVYSFTACSSSNDNNGNNNNEQNGVQSLVCSPQSSSTNSAATCAATVATKQAAQASVLANYSTADAPNMVSLEKAGTGSDDSVLAAGHYRDNLSHHPGCVPRDSYASNTSEPLVFDNQVTMPSGHPLKLANGEYPCAAIEFDQTVAEDTSKPIVILVHGNAAGVTSFTEYHNSTLNGSTQSTFNPTGSSIQLIVESTTRQMLASALVDKGYHVIGWDGRSDLIYNQIDPSTGQPIDKAAYQATPAKIPAYNRDHGWDVPLLESLIKALYHQYPDRRFSLVGHSLGVTVIRDALRRLYNEYKAGTFDKNPFSQLQDLVLASGANHGVVGGIATCNSISPVTTYTASACEMGDRAAYQETYFTKPINGPNDLWTTPCADGQHAFPGSGSDTGDDCNGNVVRYTTLVMQDLPNGALQDEFVSQASAKLDMDGCADNKTVGLSDYDTSGYFITGAPSLYANHFGSVRSNTGMCDIVSKFGD